MQFSSDGLVPLLFKVLFALIIINSIVNAILYLSNRRGMYKLLLSYWVSLLCVFVIQGQFQQGNLAISLAYGATFIPVTILALVAFSSIGVGFPLFRYISVYAASVLFTLLIHYLGGDFTAITMPLSLATAAPLLHSAFLMLIKKRATSTRLQKFLGILYVGIGIHAINFALFRMVPGSQVWGWLVAYACYDVLGILLPSIALEELNTKEKTILERMVNDRTKDLEEVNEKLKISNRKNDTLIKVLLHDVSNPLQSLVFARRLLEKKYPGEVLLQRARRSLSMIEKVIQNVRLLYGAKLQQGKAISYQDILDSVEEVRFLYQDRLLAKRLNLKVINNLSSKAKINADKTFFIYSVLGNAVSNAIKFSQTDSEIVLDLKSNDEKVEIVVADNGFGMRQEKVKRLLAENGQVESIKGTSGEAGYGMGISIIKAFMEAFGGKLDIESKHVDSFPNDHGTKLRLTFLPHLFDRVQ